jgi:DNA-binding GntR family transcriptional regulator
MTNQINSSEQEKYLPTIIGTTLVSASWKALRDAILSGHFSPGERLIETDIAKEFGVSRATVREALQLLRGDGLVTIQAHRGTYVNVLSNEDLIEIYELRQAIEVFAVLKLCRTLTTDQHEHLQGLIDEMRNVAEDSTHKNEILSQLDMKFHESICRFTGNNRLLKAWRSMGNNIFLYFASFLSKYEAYTYHERHQKVLDAIILGDPDLSREAMEYHLKSALQLVIPNI